MRKGKLFWIVSLGLLVSMGWLADIGQCADCSRTSVGFTPLNDLGQRMYRGYQGGLYPGGSNTRPANHEGIGLGLAYNITPLDRNGNPDPDNGKIVLLSIGMSNTTQEFSMFKRIADQDPDKNPQLVIVDGAQGGMSANVILDPNDGGTGTRFWTTVNQRLMQQGVTPNQVQVAWIKEADPGPMQPFPVEAQRLQAELTIIVQILKDRFPNIALAYLSSRIYAGYATTPLNPEPFAYESGFSVKWLIESQINGDEALSLDVVPWLSWGPYLWADGLVPRSDGLTWECADLQPGDGTHPSPSGQLKVAFLLLDFFKNDTTTVPWYLKG